MTNDQEPESFSLALHEAAFDFETPDHERFHAHAVQRTRQIKRRRATGGAFAGVVAVGVAGALAVTASGRPARSVSAASDTLSHPAAAASPGASPPKPASSASSSPTPGSTNAGSVTQSAVLQAFYEALPSGSDISRTQDPEAGVTAPGATSPLVNSLSGDWYVSVNASLRNSGASGYSAIEVAVTHGVQVGDCTTAEAGSTTDTCTVSHLDSGTFILDKSRHNAADPASAPIWTYYWISPAGYEIQLTIGASSVSDFALTQQQASAIVTNPAWAPIGERLPAPVCAGGKLTETFPSAGTNPNGMGEIDAKCSTDGKLYPMS